MRSSSWETRGNILFKGITSDEEVDWLHAQVLREEIRLNKMLERNNSRLIRLGIAEKIETAHIAIEMNTMFANFLGHNPSPEKIKLCTERIHATVGPNTQFRVGENVAVEQKEKSPEISVLWLGMAAVGTERMSKGYKSVWQQVGTRLLDSNGEIVTLMPKVFEVSDEDLSLSEEQLYEMGLLVDDFKREIDVGNLPHLGVVGQFDTLLVEGLTEPVEP
jgi:hypothetical protein